MLHGIAVFVVHIDAGALQGEMGKTGCVGEGGEHEFGNVVLVLTYDERLINLPNGFDGAKVVGKDIAKSVFESVGGELRRIVVGNGVEVVVGHVGGL